MCALFVATACAGQVPAQPGIDSAVGGSGDASAPGLDAPSGRDYSSDRTKFFGASRCAQAGVQLCEDFETGTLDTATWQVIGATPTIDTIQAARGTYALHVMLPGNGPSYIQETKTLPVDANGYFGRAFVYFGQLPTAPGMSYAHWTAFASVTDIGDIRISGQLQGGLNHFGVGTDSGTAVNGTGDWTNSDDDPAGAPVAVPTGTWLCIEWQHDIANSVTHFWWDATEHPSLDTTATMHGGNTNPYVLDPITAVKFGWFEYQTSAEPFELWIDELAIDSTRIGCVI